MKLRLTIAALAAYITAFNGHCNDLMEEAEKGRHWQAVSGTAIHYFSTAVIHSVVETETGLIQRSTDTIELSGDLQGRVLYHPTTVIDFATNTLTNTGHQVFSGTILGSEPVLVADDSFLFNVDMSPGGATAGTVFLTDRIAGPRTRCVIQIVGTGMTAEGDGLADYSGRCRVRGRRSLD